MVSKYYSLHFSPVKKQISRKCNFLLIVLFMQYYVIYSTTTAVPLAVTISIPLSVPSTS